VTSSRRTPLRWYFSLRSPYSWLAYRRLTDQHPATATALEWRPFWEPDERSAAMLSGAGADFPYTPMSKDKLLYILGDIRRLAREAGLEPRWPVDRDPVWEIPHLAYFAAADEGLGAVFIRRAYELRWEEGRNICDRAVMADLAVELGLPAKRLAEAADDEALRRRGLDALVDIDRDGVFGVPFFIHGREKFWGVDRFDAFIRSVTGEPAAAYQAPAALIRADPVRAGRDGDAGLAALGTGGDQGHAGGCG
jgi:2-hydroxychromene-2-carboxylate isomerase